MTDQFYNQHKNLIIKKAFSFHFTTNIPVDDLIAQGNLIFCEAIKTYDPERSKFSTWLWKRLDRELYKYVLSIKKHNKFNINKDPVEIPCFNFDSYIKYVGIKNDLTDEAHQVLSIIINSPHEIFEAIDLTRPKKARGAIVKYLRNNEGWSWPVIWKTMNELKGALC